jgi:RNA ligase
MTVTAPPLHLHDLFNPADLAAEIEAGYVSRKQHPELPISLYVYGRNCQFENRWNAVTTRCRGLIAEDATGRIVAHCLPKFFNHSQHGAGHDFAPPLPDEPFEVYDKVDGSLGIVFHYAGAWRVASKGSFVSEQATWAQTWLDAHGPDRWLEPGTTYLAEIVYPENRIVVNNGDERTLVLLAVYDAAGVERAVGSYADAWEALGGRVVRSWRALPLTELARMAEENRKLDGSPATGTDAEGWVVRFIDGTRVKIKYAEYARLHRSLTGTNARDIWQYLGAQKYGHMPPKTLGQALGCSAEEAKRLSGIHSSALSKLLENVPDEFDAWVRGVVVDLEEVALTLTVQIVAQYEALGHLHADRAAFARAAQNVEDRSVRAALFLVLDGKPIDLHVWRAVRPAPSDPFKNDEEG